jgi:electron transport complex protein RnfG
VTGVRVVTHVETPGLGDAIDAHKSAWITLFSGLSLTGLDSGVPSPAWTLVPDGGEFDQITGATVTSRAVLKAVNDAAIYFIQNRDEIFSKPAAAETAGTEAESP